MLVRCLESTSPAETLVDKGVLEDLVKCGVCFSHYIGTQRRGDTEFFAILGSPIVVNMKEIPVITTII